MKSPELWPAANVEMRPLADLAPHAKNARTHSPQQVAEIAASMKEWGWTTPILADEGGTILAGHGRVLAAEKLGLTSVPVMVARGWTEKQKRAYVLADNKLALNAAWDMPKLAIELLDLKAMGVDLTLTGFSAGELFRMAGGGGGKTDPDEVPDVPARPVSAPGDTWILGKHRLRCGDSTSATDVEALLAGAEPHLMVTDPPYGVEYDPAWRGEAKSADGKRTSLGVHAKGKVLNDDKADWREAWALFPGDVAYVWHAGLFAGVVADSLIATGFKLRSQIVWAKSNFAIGRGDYHWHHEPCWYAVKVKATGHWAGDRKQTTLWQIDKPAKSETGHSTQKPVECMKRPIENNSSVGQAVYEPFSGSGTTIIAGEMTDRAIFAMELSPVYVDVAVRRWQNFTGEQAVLDGTDKTFEDVANDRYDFRKDGFDSYDLWMASKREGLNNARAKAAPKAS